MAACIHAFDVGVSCHYLTCMTCNRVFYQPIRLLS